MYADVCSVGDGAFLEVGRAKARAYIADRPKGKGEGEGPQCALLEFCGEGVQK